MSRAGRLSSGAKGSRERVVRYELFVGWRYLKAKTKMAFIPIITFISVGESRWASWRSWWSFR